MKYFFFLALILLAFGCSEDASKPESLEGTWSSIPVDRYVEHSHRRYVIFSPDGSFETGIKIIDTATDELLGYRGYSNGVYRALGNTIYISGLVHFRLPDENQLFRDKDELLEYPGENTWEYHYSLSDFNLTLTLEYEPCEPHENCLGSEVFSKE